MILSVEGARAPVSTPNKISNMLVMAIKGLKVFFNFFFTYNESYSTVEQRLMA